jgi:hypothetical protein
MNPGQPLRSSPGRILTAIAATAALAGCGGGSGAATPSQLRIRTSASGSDIAGARAPITPALTAAVTAWAKANTPQAVCSLMSDSFKFSVSHGLPAAKCTSWITKAYGPFTVSSARIISASRVNGQTAVLADLGGNVATLYVVQECGSLKVNSIRFLSQHQPPSSCG